MKAGVGDCQSTAPAVTPTPRSTLALPVLSELRPALPPLSLSRSLAFDRLAGVAAVAHGPLGVIVILALWAIPVPRLHI